MEFTEPIVDVVIPALNEESSIGLVLAGLEELPVRQVVVADNNSTDRTAQVAREAGARVVPAPVQGYGSACLAALGVIAEGAAPEIVVFVDADYSDHPEELPSLIAPIVSGDFDLVIGSRILGRRDPGALLPQARLGNWFAVHLIRWLYGHTYTDLGPFRAISWTALERLGMSDRDFGWTAEMQVKAIRRGLRVTEVPVSNLNRVGISKITGTVRGTMLAGHKIISTILKHSRGNP